MIKREENLSPHQNYPYPHHWFKLVKFSHTVYRATCLFKNSMKIEPPTPGLKNYQNHHKTTQFLGFNPVWMEKFKLRLDVPDLAILEFKVSELFRGTRRTRIVCHAARISCSTNLYLLNIYIFSQTEVLPLLSTLILYCF